MDHINIRIIIDTRIIMVRLIMGVNIIIITDHKLLGESLTKISRPTTIMLEIKIA